MSKGSLFHFSFPFCLMLLITMTGSGCTGVENDPQEWTMIWSDEFDGAAGELPDSSKWTYDIGTDWGNQQLEYDTNFARNVSTDGEGNLRITAIQESYENQPYTSARIVTRGLFEPLYGRIEARIKLPTGQGIWPAFWMLGANLKEVGWPQSGEIDIMEYRGQEPSVIHGTIHGPGHWGDQAVTKRFDLVGARFDEDFHVFRVDWEKDSITWYVDDQLYHTATPASVEEGEWVYDHPFYILINLAIGGGFVGSPDAQTTFPQQLVVDWVRVYQKN